MQKKLSSLYSNFILNLYIVYELNTLPRNPINNFALKNRLFDTVKLTRNAGKSKFTYNGREITFDRKSYWSFDNATARNVVFFVLIIAHHLILIIKKSNFLGLGIGPTKDINGSFGVAEKEFVINFSKANTNFCLSLHYNGDESYLHVNKTGIYKFKARDNVSWYNFYLRNVSKDFTKDEHSEIPLNDTVYDFSVH